MMLEYCLGRAGDLTQGVDQHLGLQSADRIAREIRLGPGVFGPGDMGELIGRRVEDQPAEVLQVVVRRDQLPLEVVPSSSGLTGGLSGRMSSGS